MTKAHIMVDLETLGTAPGSIIRSIGACVFTPTGAEIAERFYVNVTRSSCEACGLTADPATVAWWERQSPEARARLEIDPAPLGFALEQFTTFWKRNGGGNLWSHGANFDEVLLSCAYRAAGQRPPWAYWAARCTRTVYDLAGIKPDRSDGVHHDALDDAIAQARAVQVAFARLGLEAA